MYSIKIPFGENNDMLYVIDRIDPDTYEMHPITFDNYEEAKEHASIYISPKTGEVVGVVVDYKKD